MTVTEARTAGRLLMIMCTAEPAPQAGRRLEAIKREVARAGHSASPALAHAMAQLEAALTGQLATPCYPQ